MALHVPVHHAGIAGDHLFRNFLIAVGIAIALIVVVGIAMTTRVSVGPTVTPIEEVQSLIQYRAAERADWAVGRADPGLVAARVPRLGARGPVARRPVGVPGPAARTFGPGREGRGPDGSRT